MAKQKDTSQKKERITPQQVTEMVRLRRQGYSISAIARTIGCHRQTVSTHLQEKHEDMIGDEARRQVLVQALSNHFEQLSRAAQVELKMRLDASIPQSQGRRGPRPLGPIVTDGTLGCPARGTARYQAAEWTRIYDPPPRETHLLTSLREHTSESPVWVHWDNWRKIVDNYEKASSTLRNWLEERLENSPPPDAGSEEIPSFRAWLFGNALLATSGREPEAPDKMKKGTDAGEGIMVAAYGSNPVLSQYLADVIEEAKQNPEWTVLESATAELQAKETQSELRRIVRDMDHALVGIELMHAFPGRCGLCPA